MVCAWLSEPQPNGASRGRDAWRAAVVPNHLLIASNHEPPAGRAPSAVLGPNAARPGVASEQRGQIELHVRQHQRPDQAGRLQREAGGVAGLLCLWVAVDHHRAAGDVDEPHLRNAETGVERQPAVTVVRDAGVGDLDEQE